MTIHGNESVPMAGAIIPPVTVHIVSTDVPFTAVKRRKERRITHKTIVLTAANPYQMAAQIDPARVEIHIEPIANAVVMTSSIGQASDASNMVAVLVNPNGRVLSPLVGEYVVPGGANELWFSAGVYPTLVGISIVREI